MCDVYCKELKGWCKSFTRTEALLTILELVLLIIFLGLSTLLILHFMVCETPSIGHTTPTTIEYPAPGGGGPATPGKSATLWGENSTYTEVTKRPLGKDCTWTPSKKTEAPTLYFEYDKPSKNPTLTVHSKETSIESQIMYTGGPITEATTADEGTDDGEDPESIYKSAVLALVKTRPRRDLIFGCILTVVSEYWTLTAASCIESIEEVDSLDSFVIMESNGELADGATHAVADVQINPFYKGNNNCYDLAAIKCDVSLLKKNAKPVELPQPLDYLLFTVGERFTILGYGKFRSVSNKVLKRSLQKVHVHGVPAAQCAADAWAPRHLWGGAAGAGARGCGAGARSGGCGAAAALCAGPAAARARAAPCSYCAGTPLLAARRLLGVMSGHAPCGVACEPTLYVNIAAARDWLDSVIASD